MKYIYSISAILILLFSSCQKDPIADAILDPNPGYVGDSITFTNLSLNAESYEWDLGDGTTSTDRNVKHVYIHPGTYSVSLDAYGKKSGKSTASYLVEVIGAELKVRVQEYFDLYPVRDARVRIYPTLNDWEQKTNLIVEDSTNFSGEVVFNGLSHLSYYVEVVEASHNNFTLKTEDIQYIETRPLQPFHLFVAYVDLLDGGSKKASRVHNPLRPTDGVYFH